MTDEEECLLLRSLIEGTAEDADRALTERRGSGVTQSELRALEERGVVELIHEPAGETGPDANGGHDDEFLRLLGLTPPGLEYAEGCETDPAR
jgi:hypothetical protein